MFGVAREMLKDIWEMRQEEVSQNERAVKAQVERLNKSKDAVVERIINASDARLVDAYEKKLTELSLEEEELIQKNEQGPNSEPFIR